VVLWERLPLVPVMVTVVVLGPALAAAVKVNVLVLVVDAGLKLAVTPAGRPLAVNATLPVKPPREATVTVLVAVPPWTTLALVAESEKSDAPVTVRAMVALCVRLPLVPTMEMFVVPAGVLVWALKFTTIVPLPLTEDGLKLALTPDGRPVAEIETEPVNPKSEATVTVAVGFEPGVMVTAAGGAAVMEKSGRPTTVRRIVVVLVIAPLVPVTVRVTGAGGTVALAAATKVSVLAPDPLAIDAGLKVAVTPDGRPLMLRATVPLKLLTGRTVMDVVAVPPCITLAPLPDKLKLGVVSEGTGGKAFWRF